MYFFACWNGVSKVPSDCLIAFRALLLHHHLGGGNVHIDKVGYGLVLECVLYLVLKMNKIGEVLHTKDVAQEIKPKLLALSFFVSFTLPILAELLCGPLLFCLCHGKSIARGGRHEKVGNRSEY